VQPRTPWPNKSSNNDHAIEEGIEIGEANRITAVAKYRVCLPNEVVEDAVVVMMEAAMHAETMVMVAAVDIMVVVKDNTHGETTEGIPPMGEIGNDLGATDLPTSGVAPARDNRASNQQRKNDCVIFGGCHLGRIATYDCIAVTNKCVLPQWSLFLSR